MGVVQRVQGKSVFDSLAAVNKLAAMGLDVFASFMASMGGDTWVCDPSKTVSGSGKSVAQAFKTYAEAIAAASARDALLMLPGRYTEGDLTIARAKGPLTIVGLGGRGAAYLQPSVAATPGLDVRADDVTIYNFGVAGADVTAAHALRVYGSRLRAYAAKFEGALNQVVIGPGPAIAPALNVLDPAYGEGADSRFEDCELAWGTNGLVVTSSTYGACTHLLLIGSLLHNLTGDMIDENDVGLLGAGRNIRIIGNAFDDLEDGTEPTSFLDLDSVGTTGLVAQNTFATALHATAKMLIAAGVRYVDNHVEAEIAGATGGGTLGRPDA